MGTVTSEPLWVIPQCQYCGLFHPNTACPRIKTIEYYSNGMVRRVELGPNPMIPSGFPYPPKGDKK